MTTLRALLFSLLVGCASERPQIGSWGFDLTGMDRAVAPGDDFARYVNFCASSRASASATPRASNDTTTRWSCRAISAPTPPDRRRTPA